MEGMDRPLAQASGVRLRLAVVAGVFAAAVASAPGARAASEQWYYGRTSQGEPVSIDLRNGATVGRSNAPANFQPRQFVMWTKGGIERPIPGGLRFGPGRIAYHRSFHEGAIRVEVWFRARREASGRRINGTYRDVTRSPGYRSVDTGSLRFATALWAASGGAEWIGTTAEGRRIALSLFSRPAPAATPRFSLEVPEVSHTLRCPTADGSGPVDITATARDLTAPLVGAPPVRGGFRFTTGLQTAPEQPARGSVLTTQGVSVTAELRITHLRWQGTGLRAIGRLTFSGANGAGSCDPVSTAFTLHPR